MGIGASVQLAFAADPSLGVSVPLVHPSSAASVPLAPPAGIAAPAHPPAPSSASAAFSPPLISRRPSAASIPHKAGASLSPAERRLGKKRGLFPVHRLHVGGPALGEAELVALRGPRGARAYRGIPAAAVRASVHAYDAAPPERVILHAALRRVGKLNRPRRIRRRLQGVCKKGLTGG